MAKWADILQDVVEVTAPSAEPITTTEAKQFLRVDHATQDDLIDDLIAAARQRVEADTGRSLITTTWDLSFDAFPDERAIVLPRLPLASVTSVTSYDADDTAATLSSSDYLVDTAQGRIALNDDADWPTDLRAHNSGVVRFVAGYGASGANVPQPLRLAVYQLVTHWFEQPDLAGAMQVDAAYAGHLAPYRGGQRIG